MSKKFICINCGKEYTSKKKTSKFCSRDCRRDYTNVACECEYCCKSITIYRNKYQKILSGEQKHIFCSKECATEFSKNSVIKVCEYCGKEYKICNAFKDIQRFCSRECLYKWKREKSICYVQRICEYCGEEFTTTYPGQIYCSNNCKALSQRNRAECTCDFCGKKFQRIVSEVNKTKHHYCSNPCRTQATKWNEEEINILRENYGKISNQAIQKILPRYWKTEAIKAKSELLGLGKDRKWSIEEELILQEKYPTVSLNELLESLPNRTLSSIRGKAKTMGLLSKFYLDNIYSDEEIEFLKNNYLSMSNDELAEKLNRTKLAVAQKLYLLDLHRPFEIHKEAYRNLTHFVRERLTMWKNDVRKYYNYTCQVTGVKTNLIIHHIRGFNLLFEETVDVLDFPIYDSFDQYSDDQLNIFIDKFFEIQESYNQYTCITESIHKLFHSLYGYGNNTKEQWDDFLIKYQTKQIA